MNSRLPLLDQRASETDLWGADLPVLLILGFCYLCVANNGAETIPVNSAGRISGIDSGIASRDALVMLSMLETLRGNMEGAAARRLTKRRVAHQKLISFYVRAEIR